MTETEFIEYAPEWDGPSSYEDGEKSIHTLKTDIVKLTTWYALTKQENKELKPVNRCLLARFILVMYITLIVQVFFTIALEKYAVDNSDPCEDICATNAYSQCW